MAPPKPSGKGAKKAVKKVKTVRTGEFVLNFKGLKFKLISQARSGYLTEK